MEKIFSNQKINCDKDVFSRNILFHNEIVKISTLCAKNDIKLVLLKGAALIELIPEYSYEREMEDIDVLIVKKDYKKFKQVLKTIGYEEVRFDPNVMYNSKLDIQLDIETKVWYLDYKKNYEIMKTVAHLSNYNSETDAYILKLPDMLDYICIHSYVHHAKLEHKWEQDIEILCKKFGLKNCADEFKNKFFWIINNDLDYKGHILRFLFLSMKQKIIYFFQTIFPDFNFVRLRYGIIKKSQKNIFYEIYVFFITIFLYFIRWISLTFKLLKFFNKLLKNLFLTKLLARV